MIKKFIKGKITVFIDAANLSKSVEDLNCKVSYRKLRGYFRNLGKLEYLGFYSVSFTHKSHKIFLRSLKAKDYTVKAKPLKIIVDGVTKEEIRKANFDVEIAVDAMKMLDKFETFVLFSGDSDFCYLLKELRRRRKRVIVFSTRYHIAKELIKTCHKYFDLRKFRNKFLTCKAKRR